MRRAARAGGVAGPAAFVGAWALGGTRLAGYSPVEDAISRLAASGASTQPLMTAGFLGFSAGSAAFALGLRRVLPGRAWVAALVDAAATVGVAATPLDAGVDGLHGLFAGTGYAAHVALPLLAAGPLRRRGHRRAAAASIAVAVLAAAALVGTVVTDGHHGLLQRAGLTLGDAWIVAAAVALLAPERAAEAPLRRPASR